METPHSILKKFFGYDSFRPGQEQIVQRLLAGQDVLAVMPTGAGKSICYQVPALLLPGITLVVSPLVSLMKDQVGALVQAGVAAAFLNNSLTDNQKALMLHRAREGWYKIIYVAPERLEMPGFQRFVQEQQISMVTVDEAHCISQWGQDFRPSYLRIQAFVDSLPTRPVVGAFTATTHMIKSVLEAAGRKVGMIGTNGIYFMGQHKDTANTTPESYELQKTFREFLDAGCDTALMEVSSQGLMMDRVAGVHYDVGVFTNLSPDHIGPGEHKTFEEYRSWKGQLFQRCDVGVVNIDDENTEALLEGHTCKLVTYGRSEQADYRASGYELLRTHDFLGVKFHVTGKDEMDVKVNMPGEFSVYNALAALAVGKVLGLPDQAIHDGLGKCVVKGRVELVPISKKFTILLDYAHNEVSTESLLTTLRAYNPHRLVVVFGCGGNRSKLRRYGMGEICAKMADFSILTEDNNRFEKVEDIIADIRTGMNKGNPEAKFVEIPDRLDALHYAVDHAQEGDLIAVIGKGHETYRDREGVKTPFLERELLEEYAQQKGLE